MSPRRRRGEQTVPLVQRLDALDRAVEVLQDVAPSGEVEAASEIIDRIDRRRALSAEHTVIGLFGATGSGKSSLVNALVGTEVSKAAVRRPTTSRPVAAVLGEVGSDELLDWLGVPDRHHLDGTGTALEKAGQEPTKKRRLRAADFAVCGQYKSVTDRDDAHDLSQQPELKRSCEHSERGSARTHQPLSSAECLCERDSESGLLRARVSSIVEAVIC